MKPKERRAYILEKVRQEKSASIEELSQFFNVSVQSIRTDMTKLCNDGLLQRIHGGVKMPNHNENISYDNRKIIHFDAKKSIAKLIAKKIPNGSSIFFSIGTTPEIVAKELLQHKNLKIVTNNINIALLCSENPTFEIILKGGIVRNKYRDIIDGDIKEFFSSFRTDYGIFGVGAIEEDGSLLDFTHGEIEVRNAIKKYSKQTFLIADYSKFERVAFIQSGNIIDVNSFFCNKKPPLNIINLLKLNNIDCFYPTKEKE